MFITLLKLVADKACDLAQLNIWLCEFIGINAAGRFVQSTALKRLHLDQDDIDAAQTVLYASEVGDQIEKQRMLAHALIGVLERYLAHEDTAEATKSFERALEDFSRFVIPRTATPSRSQDNSSAVTNAH